MEEGLCRSPERKSLTLKTTEISASQWFLFHCWFTTLLHVFVVTYGMWWGSLEIELSSKDITNYVLPSLTDVVVLVSLKSIIILFINQFSTANELLYKSFSPICCQAPSCYKQLLTQLLLGIFKSESLRKRVENLGRVREKGYTFVAWSPRTRVHFQSSRTSMAYNKLLGVDTLGEQVGLQHLSFQI